MKRIARILCIVLFSLIGLLGLAQENADRASKEIPANSSIREEIQRYLGYEPLLPRYLNLPYDSTMNVNEGGYFIEIGFHFLLFLPLLLLLGFRQKIIPFLVVSASLFLLLALSIPYGQIRGSDTENIPVSAAALDTYLSETRFQDAPTSYTTALIYRGLLPVVQPISQAVVKISGQRDWVTYPILIGLFFGLFFLLNHRLAGEQERLRIGVILLLTYGFLWHLLASGIIWYGYLMLPMGLLLITYGAWKQRRHASIANRLVYYVFMALSFFWVFSALLLRMANIYAMDEQAGKNILDPIMVRHQMGELTEDEVYDTYFPGLPNALNRINAESESLVYRVGTVLPYFIDRNNQRVFSDNQMGLFFNLNQRYPDKQTLVAVLNNYGFKYLLVDLNSASIDNTPEKTLTTKFNALLSFIYENPRLELLATDRIVKEGTDADPVYRYRVFGQAVRAGTFAIFQLKGNE